MKEKLKTYPALRRGVIGASIGASIMFLLALWGVLEGSSPSHYIFTYPFHVLPRDTTISTGPDDNKQIFKLG